MPRVKRAITSADGEGGGQQNSRLQDSAKIRITNSEVAPLIDDSTGGEKKHVFFWRPPFRGNEEVFKRRDLRGILLRPVKITVGLYNLSKRNLHYALCFPGELGQKVAKSLTDVNGVLKAKGELESIELFSFSVQEMKERQLKLRGLRTTVDCGEGIGEAEVELIRLVELQLEGEIEPEDRNGTAVEMSFEVEYESRNFSMQENIQETCFYRELIEHGEPLGMLERAESLADTQANLALTTLPDEGYPQVGFGITQIPSADKAPIELMWYKAGKPVAQFRWRAMEDGDTRLCIPSLVVTEVNNYYGEYYYVTLGNLEWGYDYNKGAWYMVQPDGSDSQWNTHYMSSDRQAVSSRVPVIVYDRRPPTLSGKDVRASMGQVQSLKGDTMRVSMAGGQ